MKVTSRSLSLSRTDIIFYVILFVTATTVVVQSVQALNGGKSMVNTRNEWQSIEIISQGDRVSNNNGYNDPNWKMLALMDGMGAHLVHGNNNNNILRIQVNHELDDDEATISEVNLNVKQLHKAIEQKIRGVGSGSETINFVDSARRAFTEWTDDGGRTWSTRSDFCRFCSSQSYEANTFGANRGFVDRLYITGEECSGGRLVVLDSNSRRLYVLSGYTNKMPFDSFENAALIDTGDTKHIALLLSADGGSESLMLYIGKKGIDRNGNQSNDILSRNGLSNGTWYYLGNVRSAGQNLWKGGFVTRYNNAVTMSKFEDIDTNPNNPTQVVLAESNSGVYILDFNLKFNGNAGTFNKPESNFEMRLIMNADNFQSYQEPDNVDWTRDNKIFVNRDNGQGGIYMMDPSGNGKMTIGQTQSGGESTGILDISNLLNFPPSSVIVTTNQGSPSSMTLLLNPSLKDHLNLDIGGGGSGNDGATGTTTTGGDGNDSDDCPTTTSTEHQVLEAEEDSPRVGIFNADIKNRERGYCGEGYVDFKPPFTFSSSDGDGGSSISPQSAGIVFTVDDLPTSGLYKISVKYANGSVRPRPGLLIVDDEEYTGESEEGSIDTDMFRFGVTGSGWSDWKVESKTINFDTGPDGGDNTSHTIEIWWEDSAKRPNIDWLSIDLVELE